MPDDPFPLGFPDTLLVSGAEPDDDAPPPPDPPGLGCGHPMSRHGDDACWDCEAWGGPCSE